MCLQVGVHVRSTAILVNAVEKSFHEFEADRLVLRAFPSVVHLERIGFVVVELSSELMRVIDQPILLCADGIGTSLRTTEIPTMAPSRN